MEVVYLIIMLAAAAGAIYSVGPTIAAEYRAWMWRRRMGRLTEAFRGVAAAVGVLLAPTLAAAVKSAIAFEEQLATIEEWNRLTDDHRPH